MIGLQIASGDPSDKHAGHRDPGGASSLGHHDPVIGGPSFRQQTLHVQLSLPAVALDEDGGAQEGRAPERPTKAQSMRENCRARNSDKKEGASPGAGGQRSNQ